MHLFKFVSIMYKLKCNYSPDEVRVALNESLGIIYVFITFLSDFQHKLCIEYNQ